ncbi:SCF ubiquitin ligase complex subunit [Cryptotrichosporon argae]
MNRLTRASLDLLDTQARVAALALGSPPSSPSDAPSPLGPTPTPRSRAPTATPSATSMSDDEGDVDVDVADMSASWVKGKGNGAVKEAEGEGVAGVLPPELLIGIFRYLTDPRDLVSALLVSQNWCDAGFGLLWHRPSLTSIAQFAAFTRALSLALPSRPYARHVRRLNLTAIAGELGDELVGALARCVRLERLVLAGAARLSKWGLRALVADLAGLLALDLSHIPAVDDALLEHVAAHCPRLQGLNLTGCKAVGDDGIRAAARCRALRRLKLAGCHRLTDGSLVAVARACAHLLELDLASVPQVTDDTVCALFMNCSHLRELRLNNNENITSAGFPNLPRLVGCTDDELVEATTRYAWYLSDAVAPKAKARLGVPPTDVAPSALRPVTPVLEQLRLVDLTACPGFDDDALANLVIDAPKLRNLTLAKCPRLTDHAADSLGRIGRNLHYLHLGHVAELTDVGVCKIAQTCTRLRYVDLACCTNLTDDSIAQLAENLSKLRRIGLVKVTNVTDEALYALSIRSTSLERMHLSYCDKITVGAVTFMLNRLVRLTHLSLTGVTAFKTPEYQRFCRPAPLDFNAHQQASFCVFSGHGVVALRKHLNKRAAPRQESEDGTSTRRGSDASSMSSSTIPGPGGSPAPSPMLWADTRGAGTYTIALTHYAQHLRPLDPWLAASLGPTTADDAPAASSWTSTASTNHDDARPWTGLTHEPAARPTLALTPTPRPHPARTARESLATLLGPQAPSSHGFGLADDPADAARTLGARAPATDLATAWHRRTTGGAGGSGLVWHRGTTSGTADTSAGAETGSTAIAPSTVSWPYFSSDSADGRGA